MQDPKLLAERNDLQANISSLAKQNQQLNEQLNSKTTEAGTLNDTIKSLQATITQLE